MNARFRFGIKTILLATLFVALVLYIVRLSYQVAKLKEDLIRSRIEAESHMKERAYYMELTQVMAKEKQELLAQYYELRDRRDGRPPKQPPQAPDNP